jgi:hypothetical protein
MEIKLLENYLKGDDSKKMLKKIKYICMSYGHDNFEQNFSVYDGDNHLDYNFYVYGIKFPEDVRKYLDFVFSEFAEDNFDIINWDEASGYDLTGYCQLSFLFDFKNNKIKISQSLQFYDTDYQYTKIDKDEIPENIIDTLNEVKKERKIESFDVSFEGSGDSGYIESGRDSNGSIFAIPADLEDYLYELITNYVGSGWEINEGSQGTFMFDLKNYNIDFRFGLNIEDFINSVIYEFDINI